MSMESDQKENIMFQNSITVWADLLGKIAEQNILSEEVKTVFFLI